MEFLAISHSHWDGLYCVYGKDEVWENYRMYLHVKWGILTKNSHAPQPLYEESIESNKQIEKNAQP